MATASEQVQADSFIVRVFGSRPTIFLVCLFAWTLTNMDQSLFGYAIPGILAEFNLPLSVVGNILAISFLFSALLIILAGIAADRWGKGLVLLFLLGSSAVAVGFQGLASGILMLTIMRSIGFGFSGGLSPITNTLVVENASPRYRGVAMGVLQCGYPLGWLIASLLAAPLLEKYGWRPVCFIAFLALPCLIPMYLVLKRHNLVFNSNPINSRATEENEPPVIKGESRLAVLFSPRYRRMSLASMGMFFTFGGAYAGSVFFFPAFFTQSRGYTPADAASLVGLSNGIAVLGYLGAALVGEFLITRRNVFAIWCLAGAAALLGLLWLSSTPTQDLFWFSLTAALFFGSQAVVAVFVAELFPSPIRATALAVCASAPLSLGFAVFPIIVPAAVANFGWEPGLTLLVVPLLATSAVMALLMPNRASGLSVD